MFKARGSVISNPTYRYGNQRYGWQIILVGQHVALRAGAILACRMTLLPSFATLSEGVLVSLSQHRV